MANLRDAIAALGRALESPDQTPGALRAAAEAAATALVEHLPTGLHSLVTTADMPIRLADRLDADVTSRHSFAPNAHWYRVNYAICELTWWVQADSGRRQLCPTPVATLLREAYGHHGRAAVLVDVRRSWSDGTVEHAPAGTQLYHARALRRTPQLRELSWCHLASDTEIQAFAVEAPFVEEAFTAHLAYLSARRSQAT
jgi:hypothetical protein